jgi:hypothetical protein
MSKIKPIVLSNQEDVDFHDKAACLDGIGELLELGNVNKQINVIDRGSCARVPVSIL